jgi:hypothetical protein
MATVVKSVASRGERWYISRHVLFLGGSVVRVIQAWRFKWLARKLTRACHTLPAPQASSSRSERAHPSHGSLPIIHSLPHLRSLHRPPQRTPANGAPLPLRHPSPTTRALCYCYRSRTHPSSIFLLLGTPLPPPQWVSAISPRYASAHLCRCVPWWAQSRLSLDHTLRSRNATRGRLSWQTQSSSKAPRVSRTSLR